MTGPCETPPAVQPMSAAHPAMAAARTCEHRGLYVCIHCIGAGGNCWDCVRKYTAAVPSSAARARRAGLFLGISGVVAACHEPLYLWGVVVAGARESTKTLKLLGSIGTYRR